MKILKNFAVFEGADGSGTTTQLNILEDSFHRRSAPGMPFFYRTFEPTDSPIGKLIRSGLKNEAVLKPETIAMLFAADRNEHLYRSGGIVERCGRGELVVSDRYLYSSLVYQGITCGDKLPAMLNRDFPYPGTLIFFDIDPETAEKRMSGREFREIYEYIDFQLKVRERYKSLLSGLSGQGVSVTVIDASRQKEEIADEVWRAIGEMPIFKG